MDILPNPDSATVWVPSQLGVTSWPRAAVARLPRFDEALNTIDAGITQTLIQRDAVSLRIWAYKKAHGNAIFDPEREEIVRNDMFEFHVRGSLGPDGKNIGFFRFRYCFFTTKGVRL